MRILLIEDDKEISEMLSSYLMAENFEIVCAADGQKACEAFDTGSYSIVLLDLMIPKITGMEVMKYIRQKSTVPIIIISAKDSDSDKTLGLGLGADDYITKPFSITEVMARIKATPQNTQKERPCGKIPPGRAYIRHSISAAAALIQAVRQDRLSARIRFASANRIFSLAICFRRPRYLVFRYRSWPFTTPKTCSTLARTEDFSFSRRLICPRERLSACLLCEGRLLIL